jgi:N-glycosylase/DNA lyase
MSVPVGNSTILAVSDYDLAATLGSGQAFRWTAREGVWEGVVADRCVRLRQTPDGIHATTPVPVKDWSWLAHYLQTGVDLQAIIQTFPDDEPMRLATTGCRGLRLLRQDAWESLASFILSSTKQIVQIQQIVAALCDRFGEPVPSFAPGYPARSFPSPARLARTTEAELRACKMGFRAPYLLQTARLVADGTVNLERVKTLGHEEARANLVQLPGVGPKIADCALLFGFGFSQAFPVDVWVSKALRRLYFPKRQPSPERMRRFIRGYFGPHSGYAQQYLFHYIRVAGRS